MKKIMFAFLAVLFVSSTSFANFASAAAWWGEGFRDPDWVLEHGGSIIKYKVVGKENSDDYKARMYLGEKVVEIEYGGSAYFDDAINNTYTVIIFKGAKIKDKAVVSVVPGEKVSLKFDLKKGKVEKSSTFIPKSSIKLNSGSSKYVSPSDLRTAPAPKPVPKPVVETPAPEPIIETEPEVAPIQPPVVQKIPSSEAVWEEQDPGVELAEGEVLGESVERADEDPNNGNWLHTLKNLALAIPDLF